MRSLVVAGCLFSALAWADVPGPKTTCNTPSVCVVCGINDTACAPTALDAGLLRSDCVDRRGAPTEIFCPPGVTATAGCSCSSGQLGAMAALALFAPLFRARRRTRRAA